MMRLKKVILVMILSCSVLLSGCGYNQLQVQDEDTNAKWSEVVNQYQRRADLVPNLVAVAERYAKHEQEVLTQVAQARSRVQSIKLDPNIPNDQAKLAEYQDAQAQMGVALSRLQLVFEQYPTLKADGMFAELNAELAGSENRIAVARRNYIQSVQTYNSTVRQFPTNLTAKLVGMQPKPNFSVENEKTISTAPRVAFDVSSEQ